MPWNVRILVLGGLSLAGALVLPMNAEDPADEPRMRADRNSHLAHQQLLAKARSGGIDLYFLGDSIVRRWGALDYPDFLAHWKQTFHGWNAGNFGWGADRTENILWRLENGELDGVNPKVIVLLAGTNNVGKESGDDAKLADVTRGLQAIVGACRKKAPRATIVLTAIFPRNDNPAVMPTIDRINANLATMADGASIRFLDVNSGLADRQGVLFEGMTMDGLHPSLRGYAVWAAALKPLLRELLGPPAATDHAPPPTGDPSATSPRRAVAAGDESPDERARRVEHQMTDEERFSLVVSAMGVTPFIPVRDERIPAGTAMSAGYTPGIARLGIPALQSSDASLGITNPGFRPDDKGATALPASILVGASFNPALAREGGALIGREARVRGFNVVLAGGIDLQRDPRNGRNFEYYSEDPLLTAVLGAEAVNGIQGEHVISTLKHYVLNCNETNRHWLDAVIDPAAHRESDLLAFQIAIERSQPGSIMSAYNKINGEYAGGNHHLLNEVLKGAWGYKGWVMSDWGATPSWDFALKGLDQESGLQVDQLMWQSQPFTAPLRAAYRDGRLPKERLSDMVRRILRSMYVVGIDQWGPTPTIDMARHNETALAVARQGIVLLKNDGILPLATDKALRIAVIGGHAQEGVPTGIGSSAVTPVGGYAATIKIGGPGLMGPWRNLFLLPSSPLAELRKLMPQAQIEFDPGQSPAEAALLARTSDVAILFGIRAEGEGFDMPDLTLPWGQDAVIQAVAAANRNTIVVLETGNPVAMPWRDGVKAIVQAWYPGQAGGQAIAEILTGAVNPSGRLPITFPADLAQTPRPELPGLGTPWGTPTTIRYDEGAEIGYRWLAKTGGRPLYSFGHGLGYTMFSYGNLSLTGGDTVSATFTVTNTGPRAGADVPQLYLLDAAGDKRTRLIGFERVELAPGASRQLTLTADPRLLARFDAVARQWRIASGSYAVALAKAADAPVLTATTTLRARLFGN